MKTINISAIVERCKRAVTNINANEARRTVAVTNLFERIEQTEPVRTLHEEAEEAYFAMFPKVLRKLSENKDIVKRGYFVTHRFAAHDLPANLRWTVVGTELVNRILSDIESTKPLMSQWEDDIRVHLTEMQQREHDRVMRMTNFAIENAEQRQIMCDEIVRLIRERAEIVRNYGRLFNHLKSGLGSGFRGSRGVGVIHEAMREKLKWAPHWEKFMSLDMQHAQEHDARVRAERRVNDRARKLAQRQERTERTEQAEPVLESTTK